MKLINGIQVYASWESWVYNFKSLEIKHGTSLWQRLGKLIANAIHVIASILDENTLDWDYKMRLIKSRDFRHVESVIESAVSQLKRTPSAANALDAAQQMLNSWTLLKHVHTRISTKSGAMDESRLEAMKTRILGNIELLLFELRKLDVESPI